MQCSDLPRELSGHGLPVLQLGKPQANKGRFSPPAKVMVLGSLLQEEKKITTKEECCNSTFYKMAQR